MPLLILLLCSFSYLAASEDPSKEFSSSSYWSNSSFSDSSWPSSSSFPEPPDCKKKKNHGSKDQFFPCARFVWSPVFPDNEKGVSFLGELGGNNYRLGATFGAIPSFNHRYKISGEYLAQKTSFAFSVGRAERWVHQAAGGFTYQYIASSDRFFQGMQFNGVYADAFNQKAGLAECHERNQNHPRRIAGASYIRGDVGAIISPWCNSLVILSAGFAQAEYNRRFSSKRVEGGPSLRFEFAQALGDNWAFSLEGDFQRPFNSIEGQFTFSRCCEVGHFTLGFFAGHTWGKGGLQDSTSAGVELGWSFGIDGLCKCGEPIALKPIPSCSETQDLMAWVSAPAVYMPQVLAVSESCLGPGSDPIPTHIVSPDKKYTLFLKRFFFGENLKYSIQGLPPGASFNPTTAVLTGTNDGMDYHIFSITIEAKGKCSTTKRTFTLVYEKRNA